MTKELPPAPSFDFYRGQAKLLLRGLRSGDPQMLRRVSDHHPRFRLAPEKEIQAAKIGLRDAQLILAKEHGFPNWAEFKIEIERREFLPELFAAIENQALSTVRAIVEDHPRILSMKHEGITALHLAAASNQREAVDILCAAGADPEAQDEKYCSVPRGWAYECGHYELARHMLLLASRSDLQRAAGFGMLERVREILDAEPSRIDEVSGYGTALHFASLWGHPEVVTFLLQRGANRMLVTCNGHTALQVARHQVASKADQTHPPEQLKAKVSEGCQRIVEILSSPGPC